MPLSFLLHEVQVFWQMHSHIAATAAGKNQRLVRVNMDETMVCLFQEPGKGIVLTKVPQRCRVPGRLNVSRAVRRTNLTYIAFVSDNPDFQAALPHIVVGNTSTVFRARSFEALWAAAPDNVYLSRGKTSWNNSKLMGTIVRLLATLRDSACPGALILFALDTASCHLDRAVLQQMFAADIFPLIIPKNTTWLLQPLDVFVFVRWKAHLRRLYHNAIVAGMTPGDVAAFFFYQFCMKPLSALLEVRSGSTFFVRWDWETDKRT